MIDRFFPARCALSPRRCLALAAAFAQLVTAFSALAQDGPNKASSDDPAGSSATPEWYSIHGQTTFVGQFHLAYNSPFSGPNSLAHDNGGDETLDGTLFLGIRVWEGLEFYVNPEVDQGF